MIAACKPNLGVYRPLVLRRYSRFVMTVLMLRLWRSLGKMCTLADADRTRRSLRVGLSSASGFPKHGFAIGVLRNAAEAVDNDTTTYSLTLEKP